MVLVRTGESTAGIPGTLVTSGVTGTSVVTLDAAAPWDDYEAYFVVRTGGTIGTAGIIFQWSLDGGRTLSPLTALGTGNTFTFPLSGGLELHFAAGTLVAGDKVTTRTTAPQWNGTELGTALDALGASSVQWGLLLVTGIVDSTFLSSIDGKIAGFAAPSPGKFRAFLCNTRMPNIAESEATYLSSLSTAFASSATKFGDVCAGACKLISSVSGRNYRRPVAFAVAAREASVDEEVDTADVNLGPLLAAAIRDVNGNPDEHDESAHPGLDDARFTVLRTWDGFQGVYVNRPRLMSPDGSDFQLLAHRRVFNLGAEAIRAFLIRRLNKEVQVDKKTGFILESEALEIEAGARAAMRAVLLAKPKASDVQFVLSRVDNLLSTKTLNYQARIVPLAYPEFITGDLGFFNPALQVQPV